MVVVMPIIGSWDEDRGVVKYNRSQDRPAWGGGSGSRHVSFRCMGLEQVPSRCTSCIC